MIELKAKQTAVWIGNDSDRKFEIVLSKGQIYGWPIKDADGNPDQFSLNIVKDLLAANLVELVDTRPIQEAEIR